jgi:L-ribulokinase
MVAATLCGISDPAEVKRSVCALGHKWLWNPKWGGFPPQSFLSELDPLFDGVRGKLTGEVLTSDALAGHLSPEWAEKLGLRAGIPIPVGAFDAHWDAIGAGCREGDVVNVVGTSTCIIAMRKEATLIPGVCGVVPGSVHPDFTGVEAGLSAVGDIFEVIARRAGTDVKTLSQGLQEYRAGQTGLLRLSWDNGDRTVLVKSELGGITLGWNLLHTAQDELFAAIEGTAFHTRIILDRMAEHGVPIERVINAGGIPQNNSKLNQIYADVLNKAVLVPDSIPTSVGSAIFAQVAAGIFPSIDAAQTAMCPGYKTYLPDAASAAIYEELYQMYRRVYFGFGDESAPPQPLGDILVKLREIAARSRGAA